MPVIGKSRFNGAQNVQPRLFHRVLLRRPCTIMIGSLCASMIVMSGMQSMKLALPGISAWFPPTDLLTKRLFAFNEARWNTHDETELNLLANGSGTSEHLPQTIAIAELALVFRAAAAAPAAAGTPSWRGTSGVLGEAQLRAMARIEHAIATMHGMDQHCLLGLAGACEPFTSVASARIGSPLVAAANASTLPAEPLSRDTRAAVVQNSPLWCNGSSSALSRGGAVPRLFLDAKFECETAHATYARAQFKMGGPIRAADKSKNYTTVTGDTYMDQTRELGMGFVQHELMPQLLALQSEAAGAGLEMLFGTTRDIDGVGYGMTFYYLGKDVRKAGLAVVFVLMWLFGNTGSLFLAIAGLVEILLSVPVALSVWVGLFGQPWVGVLQVMGLFILLGIGADDIFILNDALRQARVVFPAPARAPSPDTVPADCTGPGKTSAADDLLVQRFTWGYNRASSAMLVTSCTSGFAFLATAISPIPAMRAFGITMFIMIFVDYFFVITLFAAATIVQERHVQPAWERLRDRVLRRCPALVRVCPCLDPMQLASCQCTSRAARAAAPPTPQQPKRDTLGDSEATSTATSTTVSEAVVLTKTEAFFGDTYYQWLSRPLPRAMVLVLAGALVLVAVVVVALGLEISGNLPDFFKTDHVMTRFDSAYKLRFGAGESPKFEAYLHFGIDIDDPLDQSGTLMQSEDHGKPNFDPKFNLSSYASQVSMINLLHHILNEGVKPSPPANIHDGGDRGLIARNAAGRAEYECFIDQFLRYLADKNLMHNESTAGKLLEPEFLLRLKQYKEHRQELNLWYSSGIHVVNIGRLDGAPARATLAYCSFNTTIPRKYELYSLAQAEAVEQEWQKLVKAHNDDPANEAVKAQIAFNFWHFTVMGRYLKRGTMSGIAVCILLAFAVLLLTTANWILALLATGVVVAVTVVVALYMVVAESGQVNALACISLVVVVGLSVDYNVHLVHAYNHSSARDRGGKLRESLVAMGVSITSGAATTIVAAACLATCEIQFFYNFGLYILLTIILSLVFTLVVLSAVLLQFGPEAADTTLRDAAAPAAAQHKISGDFSLPGSSWFKRKGGKVSISG